MVLTASELEWLQGRIPAREPARAGRERGGRVPVRRARCRDTAARGTGVDPGSAGAARRHLHRAVACGLRASSQRGCLSVPESADGARYASYSDAMRVLDAPAIFENRSLYGLTGADLSGQRPRLEFGRGRYFEAIDVGTAAAHEYAAGKAAERAAARLGPTAPDGGTTPDGARALREAVGDPCDLAARPVMMAVATLTIRLDRRPGPPPSRCTGGIRPRSATPAASTR